MSIFKCKMCGGTIEFEPGATVGVCDSCGTKQTLPRLDDDRKANLYDRANHFRRNNEYDKAAGLYDQILNEDNTDAEAYWSLVLCRYGIEYVEDPATHKRVPTVNRAQYTSIFDDDNYRSALQYADGYQKSIYEEEAAAINEIQKGILAISQKEQPFDVFICYKETDDSGRRTQDSVLANDLYHQLTQEGFKVFFSRITLEDKLGTAYEPYIFAALNSAKVMVALGTKPAYFNAVWVKNEWSRYLALVKESGGKKVLIPAYRDMDPYDLPEEFSHLQALDMSKLGFMQDLIRGIKKIVRADEPQATVKETVVMGGGADVAPLLKRAFIFLEDGNFTGAEEYCERVLDQDPENAQAYLGKLMVEQKVRNQDALADCDKAFDTSDNYQKAVKYSDDALEASLKGYIDHINQRNEDARKDAIYTTAAAKMTGEKIKSYEAAIEEFRKIPNWKDSEAQITACQQKIEELQAKAAKSKEEARVAREQTAKKTKKIMAVVIPAICACIVIALVVTNVILPKQKLNQAMDLLDSGDYDSAYAILEELGNSDAIASSKRDRAAELLNAGEYDAAYTLLEQLGDTDTITSNKHDRAIALLDSGDYDSAYALLEEIGDNESITESKYNRGIKYIESKDYEAAYALLNGLNYKDSNERIEQFPPEESRKFAQAGEIVSFGNYEQDNNTTNGKEPIEWIVLEREGNTLTLISKDALDRQPYNSTETPVTWETCSLRTWLNDTFLNDAFTAEEQSMIPSVTVSADANPDTSIDPGNDTQDRVYLLSIPEVYQYFPNGEDRLCRATDYAGGAGLSYVTWWLRTNGNTVTKAAFVFNHTDAPIGYHGGSVSSEDRVRPVIHLKLS